MAGHVFISHGSENSDEANALCAFIEGRGVKAWIAPRDVRPGIDYSEELQLAIEACAAFVVLVTETANKSPYVRAETEMAFSCHKPIFPVRQADIKPAAGLALFLKIRHWTDAYGRHRDAALDRLALELQTVVGLAPPGPAPVTAPRPAPPAAAAPPPLAGPVPPQPVPAPPARAAEAPQTPAGTARTWPARRRLVLLGVPALAVLLATGWFVLRPGRSGPVSDDPFFRNATSGHGNPRAAPPPESPAPVTPGTSPGVGPNGEIDEEALRNALDEARNMLEQQGVNPDQVPQTGF